MGSHFGVDPQKLVKKRKLVKKKRLYKQFKLDGVAHLKSTCALQFTTPEYIHGSIQASGFPSCCNPDGFIVFTVIMQQHTYLQWVGEWGCVGVVWGFGAGTICRSWTYASEQATVRRK